MKSLITMLIFTTTLFARVDTTQNFFPLEVGNLWQYIYDDGSLVTYRVQADSTDDDGYKYYYLDGVLYYKVSPLKDSVFKVFGHYYPYLLYKFPIIYSGQIWIIYSSPYGYEYAYVPWIGYISIFDRIFSGVRILYTADIDTIWEPGIQLWYEEHYLADGIGLVWWGNEVEYKVLIGCVINGDTLGIIFSNVEDEKENNLDGFELYQNYPNPFNSSTSILFRVFKEEFVNLAVYDVLGRRIKILKNELIKPGAYHIKFDASDLPGGTYFYRLTTSKGSITKKMLYLK